MGFMDSYKRLEKLCGVILSDDRRVSAYIDEMERMPYAAYRVPGWNDDLKLLKQYRWIRNQIVHDPNCSEENMCDPEDALWLDDFHSRIMNQTDPLALYRKATQSRSASVPCKQTTEPYTHTKPDYGNVPADSDSLDDTTYWLFLVFVNKEAVAKCVLQQPVLLYAGSLSCAT